MHIPYSQCKINVLERKDNAALCMQSITFNVIFSLIMHIYTFFVLFFSFAFSSFSSRTYLNAQYLNGKCKPYRNMQILN